MDSGGVRRLLTRVARFNSSEPSPHIRAATVRERLSLPLADARGSARARRSLHARWAPLVFQRTW